MTNLLAKIGSEVGESAFTFMWWTYESECPKSLIR